MDFNLKFGKFALLEPVRLLYSKAGTFEEKAGPPVT